MKHFLLNDSNKNIYYLSLYILLTLLLSSCSEISSMTVYRKQNLRECSISQNAMNMIKPSRNTSGCKGVSYHKYSNTWRAFITKNKKQIYLGYYKLFEDAVKARKDAEVKYFGKYNVTYGST